MIVDFYKSLADETRLKIILLVWLEKELCVCELTHALSLSQPKISRHIALLRSANLLKDRRVGKWVYYRISEELHTWQQQSIALCVEQNAQYIDESMKSLQLMGNRPNRQQLCCQ
jgi:ArsR family transcriptional regulator